jgi:hypothetical protein
MMDLVAFQHDLPFVLEALRQGELDHLEMVSEAAEAGLFRHLISRQVLDRLAESCLGPRPREDEPVWLYVASQISLKLHGPAAYHAYPLVLHSGGLISAIRRTPKGRVFDAPSRRSSSRANSNGNRPWPPARACLPRRRLPSPKPCWESRALGMLGPTVEVVALYCRQRFCLLLLPELAQILLQL